MASELPEDTQLKRRARRRLIGAIALVLVAVIVLPMIFDAEKKPPSGEISIQIPNQDVYVAPPAPAPAVPGGVDGKAVPPPKDAAPAPGAKAPDPAPKAAEPAAKPDAQPAAKPEVKAEAKAPAPDAKAEEQKARLAAEAKAAKAAEAKAAETKAAEAKRAEALLNGAGAAPKSDKSADKVIASAGGSFAVQIGAFSTDEKVQEARDKLSGAGVKTYVEKVATKDGSVTRVRAGPYASKDAAEAARGKVAGLGFKGATVVPR